MLRNDYLLNKLNDFLTKIAEIRGINVIDDEILDIEQVRRRIPKLYPDEQNDEKYIRPNSQQNNTTELSELLNTIKVP